MKKVIKHLTRLLLCLFFMLICASFAVYNYDYQPTVIEKNSRDSSETIDVLREKYGKNKIIPKEIEKECLMALSHFPELAGTTIVFKYKTIKFTMQTQPDLNFIVKKRSKRSYKIEVNDNAKAYTGLDYNDLSLTAKIGWIGHELSHVCDYNEMTIPQLIGLGVNYSFDAFKTKVERRVDKITIQHGLGAELYEGVDYMLNKSAANDSYKDGQRRHYLSLEEIKMEMKRVAN